jgi:hypothetical protein
LKKALRQVFAAYGGAPQMLRTMLAKLLPTPG